MEFSTNGAVSNLNPGVDLLAIFDICNSDSDLFFQDQAAHHDTHALPPVFIQKTHWHYQSVKRTDLDNDPEVIDFTRGLSEKQQEILKPVGTVQAATIEAASIAYRNAASGDEHDTSSLGEEVEDVIVYEHAEFPGLRILPGILPVETQVLFTSQLMHRDLADPKHKINLQEDFDIPYPSRPEEDDPSTDTSERVPSFFTHPQSSPDTWITPKNPEKQKRLNMAQFLATRLRWLTLGSQYDWPTRKYDPNGTTTFPSDLSRLVTGLFPHIRPESGVVLIYSGKDYMPVHRDVSEQCQRALASFSLGCDGIFVIARGEDDGEGENRPRTVAIRVRSGDCVHLDGEARWAWHAMARTIPGTCRNQLAEWPVGTPGATGKERLAYEKWKGYMSAKRINISCRQVWD